MSVQGDGVELAGISRPQQEGPSHINFCAWLAGQTGRSGFVVRFAMGEAAARRNVASQNLICNIKIKVYMLTSGFNPVCQYCKSMLYLPDLAPATEKSLRLCSG